MSPLISHQVTNMLCLPKRKPLCTCCVTQTNSNGFITLSESLNSLGKEYVDVCLEGCFSTVLLMMEAVTSSEMSLRLRGVNIADDSHLHYTSFTCVCFRIIILSLLIHSCACMLGNNSIILTECHK